MSEQNLSSEAPRPPQQGVGSAPDASEQVGSPPQPAQEVGTAPAKKGGGRLLRIVGGLVVAAAIAAGGWFFTRDDVVNANVGDCFAASIMSDQSDASGEKVVDCAGTDAAYKVVGVVENKKPAEVSNEANCAAFPTTVGAVWLGKGDNGKIYCVEDVKK